MNEAFSLESLSERIKRFDPHKWENSGVTKESMQLKYDRCKEVSESLTFIELEMLWFLRNGRNGETYRFYKIAEQNYEALKALQRLCIYEVGK